MATDPFLTGNPFVAAIENRRAMIEAVRENSARQASSYALYRSTAEGSYEPAEAHYFGCTFIERPMVAYSFEVEDHEAYLQGEVLRLMGVLTGLTSGTDQYLTVSTQLAAAQAALDTLEDAPPLSPNCTGGVREWIRDDRGFYIGAWVTFGHNSGAGSGGGGETTYYAYYDNHVTDDPEMSVMLAHPAIPDSITVYLNGILQRFDFDYEHSDFDDNGMVLEVTLYSDMEAEAGDLLEIRYAYR